jgi:methylated-DNA-[protein]-cysteine S-methyltransferase
MSEFRQTTADSRSSLHLMDRFVPPLTDATMLYSEVPTPIGPLLLVGDGQSLTALHLTPDHARLPVDARRDPAALRDVHEQIEAYFAGELTDFDVPLAPRGTPFQLAVWDALLDIPYGHTTSYGAIAATVGRPDAPRAIGACNGSNPIAVIVPCHRVIGSDGTLTGYGGGLERKRMLLELEAEHAAPRLFAG